MLCCAGKDTGRSHKGDVAFDRVCGWDGDVWLDARVVVGVGKREEKEGDKEEDEVEEFVAMGMEVDRGE